MSPRASFELTVGSLALAGFTGGTQRGCVEAFTREFERLVREEGFPVVPPGGAPEWRLPPLSIAAAADAPPPHLGRALARGLFDALRRAAENV